jgi:hypothetical protein
MTRRLAIMAALFLAVSVVMATNALGDENRKSKFPPETISKHQIMEVFKKHLEAIKECVYKQTDRDPLLAGTMLLSMEISGNGKASDIKVLSKEHKDTYAHRCVAEVFKSMEFPSFVGDPIIIPKIPIRVSRRKHEGTKKVSKTEVLYPDYYELKSPPNYLPPLSNADVLIVMRSHISEFKECMRKQMKKDPSVKGRMVVRFVVVPSGHVSDLRVTTTMFIETIVGNCVSGVIKGLKFPKFAGKPKEVNFPFTVK